MTKSQILILLLIIALAFYLTQENKPHQPIRPQPVKKPKNPQPPKPALPKSQIEVPAEPVIK
jgi:hypothetical protein